MSKPIQGRLILVPRCSWRRKEKKNKKGNLRAGRGIIGRETELGGSKGEGEPQRDSLPFLVVFQPSVCVFIEPLGSNQYAH